MRHNMKAERARFGLTLADVAKAVGVHVNAVRRWEAGESEPLGSNLVRLSELYKCSPEYLLDQTDVRDKSVVSPSLS